jgi:hypothetical protein
MLDVQFTGSGAVYTGAAVVGSAGDFWNTLASSGVDVALHDTANQASSMTLTWDSAGTYFVHGGQENGFTGGPYQNLMNDYLNENFDTVRHITLSGLTANASYGLYIYSLADAGSTGRRLNIDANGVTATTAPAVVSPSTFIFGQNYLQSCNWG